MNLLKDISNPTPLSLLFAVYNAKLILQSTKWDQIDIIKQCVYLQSNNINDTSNRKETVNKLMDEACCIKIKHKSYIRIRIKSILANYNNDSKRLALSTAIPEWTSTEFVISFIHYLVSMINIDHDNIMTNMNTWKFIYYYIDIKYFCVQHFLSSFDNHNETGFALKIAKEICNKYNIKFGAVSKIKMLCSIWATNLYQKYLCDLPYYAPLLRLKQIMQKYMEYKNHSNNSINLDDCDPLSILNDFLCLSSAAQRDVEFEIITKELGFCDLNECEILREHYRDRKKEQFIIQHIDTESNVILYALLNKIHCYFQHCYDVGNKLSSNDKLIIQQAVDTNDEEDDVDNVLINKAAVKMHEILHWRF